MRLRILHVCLSLLAAALLLAADAPPAQPEIPLRPMLRFVIRPTLLGLVPPGDPLGYGECFVRVTETDATSIGVHYEIKELSEGADASARDDSTTIRRGHVLATGRADSREFEPPLLWGDGGWATQGALLWLGAGPYAELAQAGSTALTLAPAEPRLAEAVAARKAAAGLAQDAAARLVVQDWQARYPVLVNGLRADLPALRCVDSLWLAEYWILRDADNPLLLKMTYLAPPLSETAQSGALDTQDSSAADLLATGSGFAITSIDF